MDLGHLDDICIAKLAIHWLSSQLQMFFITKVPLIWMPFKLEFDADSEKYNISVCWISGSGA